MDYRKEIYDKLLADTSLVNLLANNKNSIYNNFDDDADFPCIVFKEVDNVPIIFSDDNEKAQQVRYQVSILTNDDEYNDIEDLVIKDMLDLKYVRKISTHITKDDVYIRILQFTKLTEV